ncbi:hypothetical protein ACIOC1_28210 [Streptomyces sp. NPDC088197]|uniref:hypothetical protein n=1 Tax=Streptomyces sp. NPDC088197 TaxID=3365840 RepID=UPI003813F107
MTDEPENVPPSVPAAPFGPPAVPPPAPAPAPVPAPAPAPVPVPAPVRSRRGPALIAVGALVAVAAGGGIGYAVLKQRDDGTSAKPAVATPWTPPAPTATEDFGAKSGGSHYGSLSELLLPMPAGYGPGPDVEGFGNDVELNATKAADLVKGDLGGLTKKQRAKTEKALAQLHIEGAGMRTYRSIENLIVEIEIVQMKNKSAAHAQTDYFTEFTKALGVFRNGPTIDGHPGATCVLPPTEPGEKLDEMLCQATEGDLMVTVTASGVVPLQKNEAAKLLAQQLDRIKDPGEAV